MTDDYGYLNARVRCLKGRLLSEESFRTALESASLAELASFLDSTTYAGAVMEALTVKKGITGIEEGLRRDFQRTIDHIVRVSGGRPRELLSIVLGRWELFNIKTVLRGRHVGAGFEIVMENVIPFGRLDEIALRELARQTDVRAAIGLLAQWRIPYASPLREAYAVYHERSDFMFLEAALDRSYFITSLRGLDPNRSDDATVADYLHREIDLILLGYALRVMHHGVAEDHHGEIFIPGGKTLTPPIFERLCSTRNVKEFQDALPKSSHAAGLAAALNRSPEPGRLFLLDRILQTGFIGKMRGWVIRDPLSIDFTIGYLQRKVNEIVNLRIIARGIHTGLPRVEIEALLFAAG